MLQGLRRKPQDMLFKRSVQAERRKENAVNGRIGGGWRNRAKLRIAGRN